MVKGREEQLFLLAGHNSRPLIVSCGPNQGQKYQSIVFVVLNGPCVARGPYFALPGVGGIFGTKLTANLRGPQNQL